MSNLKKTHEPILQNGEIVKKSQKHETNLQKNTTLYFQIGLMACLLAAFSLLEMKFETTISHYGDLPPLEEPMYVDVPLIKAKVPELVEHIEQQQNKSSNTFEEVPNDTPELPFLDEPNAPIVNAPDINPEDINPIEEPVTEEMVNFVAVEQVPIYPGCETKKTNEAKRQCMSDKITKLVQKKFDTNLTEQLGLSGKQVIQTQFTIDKTGKVNNIKTRGTHPLLEKEAERVINTIPIMVPGKQRNTNVNVIYTLPIIFHAQ